MTDPNVFNEIYEKNDWGYGSGVGSLPINNVEYIRFIQSFIKMNNVGSIVDFGCGDWQFSRFIDWNGATYQGYDIAEAVIARNTALFRKTDVRFNVTPNDESFAQSDLIICKDVFQHLSNEFITRYIKLFKTRSRLVLITNDVGPAEHLTNTVISNGEWRPTRLDFAPFNETAPILLTWTTEWGGWKPTRKATALLQGNLMRS